MNKSKVTIISIIAIIMGLYLIARAPYCIDKSQDIVIKKLSGLSGFVEKEGKLRIDAGKRLLEISSLPAKFNIAEELTVMASKLKTAADKELKNPKLKGAGEILTKLVGFVKGQSKIASEGGETNLKMIAEKGNALIGGGNKMVKKSGRLMQMVSLRMYITSYWRGLMTFGGFFLLLAVYALRRNESWAFPSIVTILALVPIGVFYISLAGAVFFKEPAGFTVFGIGLVAFWAVLFIGLETTKERIVYITVLTLLGMVGTDVFSFAEHGIRGILAMPYAATATDSAQAILRYSGPIALFSVITVLIAIYKIAAKNPMGWWFAAMSGFGIMAVGFPVDALRHKDSFFFLGMSMSTYMFGGILGVILLIVLFVPYFRKILLPKK